MNVKLLIDFDFRFRIPVTVSIVANYDRETEEVLDGILYGLEDFANFEKFIYEATDPSKISTDQPYVSRSLSKALGQTTATTAAPNPASNYTLQNSIRKLGIILLELCFGKVVEDHTLSSDLGMAAAEDKRLQFLKYCVATDWLKRVVEESGPEYANAVNGVSTMILGVQVQTG
ncbi:uncharacterized protein L3040_003123 [Drepanopeziza brunnea f. sp. 'multigermtubi']|uniref:uncharacterized protein n=1 Tax=Drepanopeziza brunnea f. sp. 'multigermtubi' TaxID=698441 RepID=UPI00239252A4|nr:hypothetical protein L3040_003123 [Drepanopeziza brunnea f. sp. 'multigermtubi']